MLPKFDTKTIILVAVVVVVTLKFYKQIGGLVAKIPVVGPLVVG